MTLFVLRVASTRRSLSMSMMSFTLSMIGFLPDLYLTVISI
nr:MAG TPA: hypothetical protein [Caudoviricetes sp.]